MTHQGLLKKKKPLEENFPLKKILIYDEFFSRVLTKRDNGVICVTWNIFRPSGNMLTTTVRVKRHFRVESHVRIINRPIYFKKGRGSFS